MVPAPEPCASIVTIKAKKHWDLLDTLPVLHYLCPMNIPSPAAVASARTARLVREAATPVYSTSTPTEAERLANYDHLVLVELDSDFGRSRQVMRESETEAYLDGVLGSDLYWMSDYCHAARCGCGQEDFIV